jgi:hypothetical protein
MGTPKPVRYLYFGVRTPSGKNKPANNSGPAQHHILLANPASQTPKFRIFDQILLYV